MVFRWFEAACCALLAAELAGGGVPGGLEQPQEQEHREQRPEAEACDRDVLVAVFRQIEPTVALIADIHFNFTGSRHYEVVEIISVFQIDRLAHSALRYIESLRLTLGVLICPQRFDQHVAGSGGPPDSEGILARLRLVEHLNEFFGDIRHMASQGGTTDVSSEAAAVWDAAEAELRDVSQRLEGFVKTVYTLGRHRLLAETYVAFEPLIQRVLNMVIDYLQSLAEDTCTLFSAPNYVAVEMIPLTAAHKAAESRGRNITVDVFRQAPGGLALHPRFAAMLGDPTASLTQPGFSPGFRECDQVAPREAERGVLPMEFRDQPASLVHRDVSGRAGRRGGASALQLLQAAARHAQLSNVLISVQVAPYLLAQPPSCGSSQVLYDPSECLVREGWGAYFFQMNPLPPFNLTVVYSGKPMGPGVVMPLTDVHSIHVPSMDTQWSSLVSTFKSMNHHTPDLLFVNPFVGNCQIVDRLLGTGSIRPKLVYLPINPLEPPPRDLAPDFFGWWTEHSSVLLAQLLSGVTASQGGPAGIPVSTSVWLAQCSLVAGARTLEGHGYALLHVEHTFAVFLWRPLFTKIFGDPGGQHSPDALHAAWLRGWQCSPHARYLFDLEVLAGADALESAVQAEKLMRSPPSSPNREVLREYAAAELREVPTLRYFLEQGEQRRGRCAEGLCECFPPYRGSMCEHLDQPRVPQSIRAVIHYITAETERDLVDLARSLQSVWLRFNQHSDYPVVVFHEGLSREARLRIIGASENRVWLALLPRFKEVPAEWASRAQEMAQDFSVGYCAMTRWRSGPVFLEPALESFDFAMTLDTDSYFPADLAADPFEVVQREGWVAGFPHLGRESASVVVNFMHYFLLYCRLKDMHPRRTEMLASLIESNFKWYQQCLMLDIEVLRLDWFRGAAYQDLFRYLDSTGGFWLHRWGNNPVRTFAVALLLEDRDVRSLDLPYAHQDYCSCGPGALPCRWDKQLRLHVCEDAATPRPIAAGDLAEGLLDLQPWRGTARQKQRFRPNDIHQFVQEQMPL